MTDAKAALPKAMPGFENVRRYRDPSSGNVIAKLLPGDFYVTREDEVLDTVLGSCVSACIRNPKTGVGGMNHFMLPHPRNGEASDSWSSVASSATRYGSASMEQLINKILGAGGTRTDLEVKLFGGARVLAASTDVGQHNVTFVRDFLKQEGLRVASEDLGNTTPRHIQYFPSTGKVRVKHLGNSQSAKLISEEASYSKSLDVQPVAGSIDLF
ncbi:MAG: chemoreceptor glutamine deamidase CheD [Steroidobacteraceae bacterium]